MKLRCERDVLVEGLSAPARAAGLAGGRAATAGGVHLSLAGDLLRLSGNDGDLTICVEIVVAGGEDGVCMLPARLTLDIVRSVEPGSVLMEIDRDEARIIAGRSHFGVRLLPERDFPLARAGEGDLVELAVGEFSEALRQVVRAASTDEHRPSLNGVLLSAQAGGLRLVATDAYRLAERTLAGHSLLKEGQEILVPARALVELQRLMAATTGPASRTTMGSSASTERRVTFQGGQSNVTFVVGDVTLTTTLMSDFPNVARLFSQTFANHLLAGKEPLLEAIRRVRVLARDTTSWLRATLEPDRVQLMVMDEERGHAAEDVDAKYEGAPLGMQFNPSYLIEGIEGVIGDEVLIEIESSNKPVMIHGCSNDPYRYLLAPRSI